MAIWLIKQHSQSLVEVTPILRKLMYLKIFECECVCDAVETASTWRSEDNFVESVSPFTITWDPGPKLGFSARAFSFLPTKPVCWPQETNLNLLY